MLSLRTVAGALLFTLAATALPAAALLGQKPVPLTDPRAKQVMPLVELLLAGRRDEALAMARANAAENFQSPRIEREVTREATRLSRGYEVLQLIEGQEGDVVVLLAPTGAGAFTNVSVAHDEPPPYRFVRIAPVRVPASAYRDAFGDRKMPLGLDESAAMTREEPSGAWRICSRPRPRWAGSRASSSLPRTASHFFAERTAWRTESAAWQSFLTRNSIWAR